MLFNSFTFAGFFLVFFILYWFVFNKSLKLQNILILAGSYFFYAWWDWRFLSLLIASSLLNYFLGIYIGKSTSQKQKRLFLWIGLIQGIGGLIFFKYFNFFIVSLTQLFSSFNVSLNIHVLNIILPLGISFYTFRTLSYLLDIKNKKIEPTHDWIIFFSHVAFFPSLISGPIDKAKTLIPQLETPRKFNLDEAVDGSRQILWGLFKKIVVADGCAIISKQVFEDYSNLPGSTLLIGIFFFTLQIYADFSGYSDIAIGIARLLGFNITKNFDFPFFAQNIADFWRRWHISLTSWMTEYVFTPLSISFRDYDKAGLIMAILINFVIIGIWHGANWTFLLFGFLHGCYYIPLILRGTMNKKKKINPDEFFPSFAVFRNMVGTFILVMLTFVVFQSATVMQALEYYKIIFSPSLFSKPVLLDNSVIFTSLFFVSVMILIEWLQRTKDHALQINNIKSPIVRFGIYYALILITIYFYGSSESNQFIYFKF